MSAMKRACDIWWWLGNDKITLALDISVFRELWLVEAFLLPPIIPCRLDNGGDVGFVVIIVERLED